MGDKIDPKGKLCMEDADLWHYDILDCVCELLENPAFEDKLVYEPSRIFKNEHEMNREYSEMWMANWWWDTQVCFE